MSRAVQAFLVGHALPARATTLCLLLCAAFNSHLLYVSKRSKFLPGNLLDAKISTVALSSEAANGHTAEGKRELDCLLKAQRSI
jgi:hypothetical protein